MRFLLLFLIFFAPEYLQAATHAASAADLWRELEDKRRLLTGFHQEYEVTRTYKLASHSQTGKETIILDSARGRWRSRVASGVGDRATLFDGRDEFEFEEGGSEFVRIKTAVKDGPPLPPPYESVHLDLLHAVEQGRKSCELSIGNHECVIIDAKIKPWLRQHEGKSVKMLDGTARFVFDTTDGLILSSRTMQTVDNGQGGYVADVVYALKRMSYNGTIDEAIFRLPQEAGHEVHELSRWNADKIRKQLAGKPTPPFVLTDLQGRALKASDLQGKTVLLDFFTTWCGPCQMDAPSLDALHRKYGGKNLVVIGVSVNEDRDTVKDYLRHHPHEYPIVLTGENEMPRPYQIGTFPTYVVIDANGTVAAASEGDRGFSDLKKMLKKAGLETD